MMYTPCREVMTLEEERFEEFASLVSGIHGNIQKLKGRYAASLGLKAVHVFWLYLLRTHPEGLSASELAAVAKADRSLVSREIDALLKADIVCTLTDGEHRRYAWKLGLTEKGKELSSVISVIAKHIQDNVNLGMSEEDLLVFYKVLHTLADGFDSLTQQNNIQELIDHECQNH